MPRPQPSDRKVSVVFLDDDPLLTPSTPAKGKAGASAKPGRGGSGPVSPKQRLASLDAYRGFVMLLMASGALGFARMVTDRGTPPAPDMLSAGGDAPGWWATIWNVLAYQFDHVPWVGCTIWDLIQPSFMFIVGAAMPFSFAKRAAEGQGAIRRLLHVAFRALVLVALGVFLSSNGAKQTNFTFVNVLTQIGLGYVFVYLLLNRPFWMQAVAAAVILIGYWAAFVLYAPPETEAQQVGSYVAYKQAEKDKRAEEEARKQDRPVRRQPQDAKHREADLGPWKGESLAAHWNKHTNFAAAADRWLLNETPRAEEAWPSDGSTPPQRFWINDGGYQTLNFIPAMATMLFGVMAGQLLLSNRRRKVLTLLVAGAVCFVLVMALDTTIWPIKWHDGSLTVCAAGLGDPSISAADLSPSWSFCPTVKRIWTPTWTIFSTGWTLWLLAGFYLVMDVWGFRAWAFPLKVVGMNSIAMYVMAQLMQPWVRQTIQTHLGTVSAVTGQDLWTSYLDFDKGAIYAPFFLSAAVLGVLWLMCLWMYRQKIFVRI